MFLYFHITTQCHQPEASRVVICRDRAVLHAEHHMIVPPSHLRAGAIERNPS